MARYLCTRLLAAAATLMLTACAGSPSTPTPAPQSPPPAVTPAPPPTPPSTTQTSFAISLPVRPGDSAHNAYGLVPFGVHIGDHGVDGHPGWDFEFAPGASVYAAAAGTVQSVLPAGAGFVIQITHSVGTRSYRTIYNVGTLAPGVAASAAITAGQALGVADVLTRTIGRTRVTYAMTHFQVDDFSSNAGLTNQHAVSAEQWLDASARAALDAIWRDAAYTQEFVEPFLANPRDVSYPLTRRWSLQSGRLVANVDMTAATPQSTTFSYTLRDANGTVVEQGIADVDALAKPHSTIDFTPSGSSQPRRGVYNIVGAELQIDFGPAGAPRPESLAAAATYRTQ